MLITAIATIIPSTIKTEVGTGSTDWLSGQLAMKKWYLPASIISVVVGLVFLIIGDGTSQGAGTTGWQFFVLAYFHGITWLLLSVFFMLKHKSFNNADYIGYAALVVYIVFLATLFLG
ncbi:MAG: hypothetical protein RID53_18640 [Coleofasciculus sp. B1-GNL1-01]|uniref:hypothetical protein n=1 Tax=Coleofasciculus sp. B1-GNL1-01 TaxID=3068484 RepID=UPI00330364AD